MRLFVFAAAVASLLVGGTGSARADSFLDLEGGFMVPVSDSDWTNLAESSPKLAVHAGSIPKNVGGIFTADWTPLHTDFKAQFPNANVSAHRFRFLVGAAFQSPVKAKLMFTGRLGVGVDIAYASASTILGDASHTDAGFAFEMGVGVWAKLGSVALGGEVALPVATHDHKANNLNDITMQYTSVDVDVIFGVRLFND